jgi:type VI secretion system Hcp family effector
MADILIKFSNGIVGESTVAKHENWIEISSFSEGLSSPGSTSSGTGSSAGKSNLSNFNFSAVEGAHTVDIIKKGTSGKHFDTVEVHYLKQTGAEGGAEVYRSVLMTEVYITGWNASRSENSTGYESFSMEAATAKWEYFAQDDKGILTSKGQAKYDQKTGVIV